VGVAMCINNGIKFILLVLAGVPYPLFSSNTVSLNLKIAQFDSIIAQNPQSINALVELGNIYQKVGILDESERFYQKAFSINPDNVEVIFALGKIAFDKGDFVQARILLGKCTILAPQNTQCLNMLAEIALIADRDTLSAKKFYERVLKIDTSDEKALFNSSVLQLDMGDTVSAIDFLEKYITAYPDSNQGRLNLGILYEKSNRFHDALIQFTKLLKRDTTNIEALQSLGVLYFKRKVYMESNAIFERVQNLRYSLPVSIGLALGYYFEKEPDRALAVLNNSILNAKENAYMLRLLMADIAFMSDRNDAAIEYCKLAHELQGSEHVEQEIVNVIYQNNDSKSIPRLHKYAIDDKKPLYEPGSIIRLFISSIDN
jgi:tetratricopeptide (TPR) repeat protein